MTVSHNQTAPGHVALIFYAHAPFLRQSSPSGAGEELLHDLITTVYAPLLAGVYSLADQGTPVRLALALSPTLLEQLADPVVQKHTFQSLEQAVARAEQDLERWQRTGDDHAAYVAQFYVQLYTRSLNIFDRQFGRNLVGATRGLIERGIIEALGTTATDVVFHNHDDLVLRMQVKTGLICTMRHLGRRPTFWWAMDEMLSADLVALLAQIGVRGIVGGNEEQHPGEGPYWLDADQHVMCIQPPQRLLTHLISPSLGYAGDELYRSTQRTPDSGLHYWSQGATSATLAQPYDPYHAYARARLHAQHFVAVLHHAVQQRGAGPTLLPVAVPMELFGYTWFEGGVWLRALIEAIAASPLLCLTTPSEYVHRHPPTRVLPPRNRRSRLVDGPLYSAFQRLRTLVTHVPDAGGDRERVLNQAGRELLLAQSGDWDRWHATNEAYAVARRETHLARLNRLIELAEYKRLPPDLVPELAQLEEQDNPFLSLNYRLFGE